MHWYPLSSKKNQAGGTDVFAVGCTNGTATITQTRPYMSTGPAPRGVQRCSNACLCTRRLFQDHQSHRADREECRRTHRRLYRTPLELRWYAHMLVPLTHMCLLHHVCACLRHGIQLSLCVPCVLQVLHSLQRVKTVVLRSGPVAVCSAVHSHSTTRPCTAWCGPLTQTSCASAQAATS